MYGAIRCYLVMIAEGGLAVRAQPPEEDQAKDIKVMEWAYHPDV